VDKTIHGIVGFHETDLRPIEGGFLEIWIAKKLTIIEIGLFTRLWM
jgi:hypothetical protein